MSFYLPLFSLIIVSFVLSSAGAEKQFPSTNELITFKGGPMGTWLEPFIGSRIKIDEFSFQGKEFSRVIVRHSINKHVEKHPTSYDATQLFFEEKRIINYQRYVLDQINSFSARNYKAHNKANKGSTQKSIVESLSRDPENRPLRFWSPEDLENGRSWLNQVYNEGEYMAVMVTEKNNISNVYGTLVVKLTNPKKLFGHFSQIDASYLSQEEWDRLDQSAVDLRKKKIEIYEIERLSLKRSKFDALDIMVQALNEEDIFWQKNAHQNGDLVPLMRSAKERYI